MKNKRLVESTSCMAAGPCPIAINKEEEQAFKARLKREEAAKN